MGPLSCSNEFSVLLGCGDALLGDWSGDLICSVTMSM